MHCLLHFLLALLTVPLVSLCLSLCAFASLREIFPRVAVVKISPMIKRVCVFCGSSWGARPVYEETARAVGEAIARRGLGLVYGGAQVGLMGVVADAVLHSGGEVIGVIPEMLADKELAHRGLTELRIVASMHERKAQMAELADAFIALPGGLGTWEEFCEVVTWAQLGLHRKPCGLLNVEGFYDALQALTDHAVAEGFVRPIQRGLVLSAATIDDLFVQFENYAPPTAFKVTSRDET